MTTEAFVSIGGGLRISVVALEGLRADAQHVGPAIAVDAYLNRLSAVYGFDRTSLRRLLIALLNRASVSSRCYCPGDCNCRHAGPPYYRTNYCGCRAHSEQVTS